MTLLLLFLAVAGAGGEPPPVRLARPEEAAPIVLEVLRFEATHDRRGSICARRRSEGVTFDWPRSNGGFFGWAQPSTPRHSLGYDRWPKVEAELSAALDAAANAAIAETTSADAPMFLERRAIPDRLQSDDASCSNLTYRAPVIVGDIAFVDTVYSCGRLCAEGWRYGLRYSTGRWSLAAINFLWVS